MWWVKEDQRGVKGRQRKGEQAGQENCLALRKKNIGGELEGGGKIDMLSDKKEVSARRLLDLGGGVNVQAGGGFDPKGCR